MTMVQTNRGLQFTEEYSLAKIVTISKFKATCLALLNKVKRTGVPILVTRKGEPIAQVVPPPPPEKAQAWVGSFHTTGYIVGDVMAPSSEERDWEVLIS